jgi:acyl dehydratase
MLEVSTLAELEQFVGRELGTSDWLTIDQARIDAFAQVSGDDNWIHVDVERARRELPDGRTIAHGMLTFSLLAYLGKDCLRVGNRLRGMNYGSNKARFAAAVPCDARIRLHRTLKAFEPVQGGARLTFANRVEVEGVEKPALFAETISIIYTGEAA